MTSYFEFYGLPETFTPDAAALQATYYRLSRSTGLIDIRQDTVNVSIRQIRITWHLDLLIPVEYLHSVRVTCGNLS